MKPSPAKVVAITLVLGGCLMSPLAHADGGAAPAADKASTSVPTSADVRLDNAVQNLHDSLSATDPSLTAVIARHDTRSIEITTSSGQDAAAQAAALTAGLPVTLKVVPHSFSELTARMDSVGPVIDQLTATGTRIRSYGIDMAEGKLDIELDDFSPAAQQAVRAALGDVVLIDTSKDGQPTAGDRANDSIPWWAGDFITDYSESCTSGFGTHNNSNGYDYIVAAGHCLFGGHDIYNGSNCYAGAPCGSNKLMGHVYTSYFGSSTNGYRDEAVIRVGNTQTQGASWRDTGTGYVFIKKSETAQPGQLLCISGAYSSQRCGYVSTANYLSCESYDGQKSCRLIEMNSYDGNVIAGNGDSGGPVYRSVSGSSIPNTNGQGVAADGMFVVFTNTSLPCLRYPTNRHCGTQVRFVDLPSVLSGRGLTIRTD
jgi:hypothetical protein